MQDTFPSAPERAEITSDDKSDIPTPMNRNHESTSPSAPLLSNDFILFEEHQPIFAEATAVQNEPIIVQGFVDGYDPSQCFAGPYQRQHDSICVPAPRMMTRRRTKVVCPNCHKEVWTKVDTVSDGCTLIWVAIMAVLILPCFWLPFCCKCVSI